MEKKAERPATAIALERWRTSAGLSRQRLADLADVSATYVRTIEAGTDDLGREVVPSAAIMQKLAHGLAQALAAQDDARREALERAAYAELLAAAGYLPDMAPPAGAAPDPALREEPPPQRGLLREAVASRYGGPMQMHPLVASDLAAPPSPAQATVSSAGTVAGPASVILRDPRLLEHGRDLLEHWESLDPDDQTLLLGIMAWVHERRRGAPRPTSGGI